MQIHTTRLTLIATNAELARLEIEDRAAFAACVGAVVPADRPPAESADVLPLIVIALDALDLAADKTWDGWMRWYIIAKEGSATLIASVSIIGKPDADGVVEMGYSVLPDNEPSQRVLRGAHFAFVGDSPEIDPDDPDADHRDHLRFERWRDSPVLTAKPFYLTSIPAEARAVPIAAVREHELPYTDYFVGDEKVGCRYFEGNGVLFDERAYRNSRPYKHAYTWHDAGAIHSCETFDAEGLPHGTAYQWADDGRLVGSYTLTHGTGSDLWWQPWDDGTAQLSEIHMLRDGERHGYEWWLDENEIPYSEKHWQNFTEHGIEREWNDKGRLKRGFPRYWLHGQRVRKDRYVRAAAKDDTLPPFRVEDNLPARQFPPEVEARRRLHANQSANNHG